MDVASLGGDNCGLHVWLFSFGLLAAGRIIWGMLCSGVHQAERYYCCSGCGLVLGNRCLLLVGHRSGALEVHDCGGCWLGEWVGGLKAASWPVEVTDHLLCCLLLFYTLLLMSSFVLKHPLVVLSVKILEPFDAQVIAPSRLCVMPCICI